MITAKNIKNIKTVSAVTPTDTLCTVEVRKERPDIAIIDDGTRKVRLESINLSNYFEEFVKFDDDDIESIMLSDDSKSLTGKTIEPDGWDEKGFPSVLLTLGLI